MSNTNENRDEYVNTLMKYFVVTGDFEVKLVQVSNPDGSVSMKPVLGGLKVEALNHSIGKVSIWYNAYQLGKLLRYLIFSVTVFLLVDRYAS
jgi:hypothetical protein